MKQDGVTRAIIVVQAHMTPFARQSLLETERSKYHIEQFHEQELLVNITEHVLVPQHQLLSGARPSHARMGEWLARAHALTVCMMHDECR